MTDGGIREERKKNDILPSFTRPAFGNVSELNTDFAISQIVVNFTRNQQHNHRLNFVFTTTLRTNSRDVVFSPSWDDWRMNSRTVVHAHIHIRSPRFDHRKEVPS